jgi:hypothetical protein
MILTSNSVQDQEKGILSVWCNLIKDQVIPY